MELQGLNGQAARRELDRVVSSSGFARNERLSRFLRFLVERHLEGKDGELKESVIGIEVFGRKPGYDPKQDAVVRTEAIRLRARLTKYYSAEGSGDALVIELPRGGYTPVFRSAEAAPQSPRSSPSGPSRRVRMAVGLAASLVVTAVLGWWWLQQRRAPIAIAVLPLANLNQDPASDYLADGLTFEIIHNLAILDGLTVRSQTSTFAFKGKPRNVREAGEQLNADYILEGAVLRAGQRLRINAQLIRVRDDFPVWSGRFDKQLTDVLSIQDEISRGVVNGLRLKLGHNRRRYETSPEAYELYLRARAAAVRRGVHGFDESIAPFEQAIARDPSFAPAYAGLASARALRSGQFRFNLGDELTKMRVAAERAIELDPLLAEAYSALGMAYARDVQWEASEKSFRRAIELEPSRSTSYGQFVSNVLLVLGRIDEALRELRVAERADPLSPEVHRDLGVVLNALGRYDEAARYFEKLPEDYTSRTNYVATARLRLGRTDEAIRLLETAFNEGVAKGAMELGALGCAYALVGRREDAETLAAASTFNPFNPAQIFACLGDKDRAFEALDRAAAAGPVRIGRALHSPEYALLRGDPRVKVLRKKVGLPE